PFSKTNTSRDELVKFSSPIGLFHQPTRSKKQPREEKTSMAPSAALAQVHHDDEHCWRNFRHGTWSRSIDVRDFIVSNVTPYIGDEKFLAEASKRTKAVWAKLQPYFEQERKKGVLAVD